MGDARGDRPLIHVDPATELSPIGDDDLVGAEVAVDVGRRVELDVLRGRDSSSDRAVYLRAPAPDVCIDVCMLANRDRRVAHRHAAVDLAIDGDVFVARQLTRQDNGSAETGHGWLDAIILNRQAASRRSGETGRRAGLKIR